MSEHYAMRIISHALKTCGYYPLRPMQSWLINTHLNKVKSTMMNIGALYKLDNQIDMEKAAKILTDITNEYDIFRSRLVFHPETGDLCQRFDGEIIPVKVEKISDEEFEQRKKILKQPYQIINCPLYRFQLFETPTAKYAYSDFYHAMFDGVSAAFIFLHEANFRYKGKKINRKPPKYSEFILEELLTSPEKYVEGEKYWHDMLKDFDVKKHLPPADLHGDEEWKSNHFLAEFKNITSNYFSNNVRKEEVFFLAASMLAIAKSAGVKKSIMSRIHNGRTNAKERRIFGIMLEQIPISWDFEKDTTVEEFLDGLENEMAEEMQYRRSLGAVYSEGLQDDCATFIFQKKAMGVSLGADSNDITFGDLPLTLVEMPDNKFSAAENTLDIEFFLMDAGNYVAGLDFDASRYSENAMQKFAAILDEMILQLQDENKLISEILG